MVSINSAFDFMKIEEQDLVIIIQMRRYWH